MSWLPEGAWLKLGTLVAAMPLGALVNEDGTCSAECPASYQASNHSLALLCLTSAEDAIADVRGHKDRVGCDAHREGRHAAEGIQGEQEANVQGVGVGAPVVLHRLLLLVRSSDLLSRASRFLSPASAEFAEIEECLLALRRQRRSSEDLDRPAQPPSEEYAMDEDRDRKFLSLLFQRLRFQGLPLMLMEFVAAGQPPEWQQGGI